MPVPTSFTKPCSPRILPPDPAFLWGVGLVATAMLLSGTARAQTVGKWRRHVIELPNSSYTGNPFEVEVTGTFRHAESGTELTLPGYFAGDDRWKLGFMPTEVGPWSYVTSSDDAELDGVTGTVECVESGHPGLLTADPDHPRKWKFSDGPYVVPLGLLFSVALEDGDLPSFTRAADFLRDEVGGQLFNFRLTNVAFDNIDERRPNLVFWDRLEERMEVLTERGLGVTIMLHTDDGGRPPYAGQSRAEALLIRTMVARLAGFPAVMFNTGIDIAEYRSDADLQWYGRELERLDPYHHPFSSRSGGGSGRIVIDNETYRSIGQAESDIGPILSAFRSSATPVVVDDNWGEQFRRGNFSPGDIRRAAWKCVVAGGVGTHIRDDRSSDFPGATDPDAWFHTATMADKLDSEQWLALVNRFVQARLSANFGAMVPAPDRATGAFSLADPDGVMLLFWVPGRADQYDRSSGGPFTVDLRGLTHDYSAIWFDPRTGSETEPEMLSGDMRHAMSPATEGDWVLWLVRDDTTPCTVACGYRRRCDFATGDCACTSGTDCDGSCVQTDSDSSHCGGCGVRCETSCEAGLCAESSMGDAGAVVDAGPVVGEDSAALVDGGSPDGSMAPRGGEGCSCSAAMKTDQGGLPVGLSLAMLGLVAGRIMRRNSLGVRRGRDVN